MKHNTYELAFYSLINFIGKQTIQLQPKKKQTSSIKCHLVHNTETSNISLLNGKV